MSSSRKAHYAPKREQDSFEELSGKLTADLRNHVRFMVRHCLMELLGLKWLSVFNRLMCVALFIDTIQADYPVLSDDWNQMAEQIGRIGDITEMVGNLS